MEPILIWNARDLLQENQELADTNSGGHCYTENHMDLQVILTQIDEEIARLQQAKELLTGSNGGNLKLPLTQSSLSGGSTKKPVKRQLSPEAIARIRAAQKRRWAKFKKAAK
jgi:hypothetical protein